MVTTADGRGGVLRINRRAPGHQYWPHVIVDEQAARLNRISAFYREIDRMFVPYMRLDQRMPLWWWTPFTTKIKGRASSIAKELL